MGLGTGSLGFFCFPDFPSYGTNKTLLISKASSKEVDWDNTGRLGLRPRKFTMRIGLCSHPLWF